MSSKSRIKRDELYMTIAALIAQRGTCERLRVGAIIVKEGRACATGYNGTPPGDVHCNPLDCDTKQSCKVAIHAEANAIAFAARFGLPLEGTTLYITHAPCRDCAELLVQVGINHIVYGEDYGDCEKSIALLRRNNIRVRKYESIEL